MKFNSAYTQIMKESLLEGNADYSDVMDAVGKLETALESFKHIYPADRGTHIHAAYKAQIEQTTNRITDWIKAQNTFMAKRNKGEGDTENTTETADMTDIKVPTDVSGSLTSAG